MSELKKCCRYCSNFRDHTCQLKPFEIQYIEDCFGEEFDGVDFDEIEEEISKNIIIKDPDDFYCKYYT